MSPRSKKILSVVLLAVMVAAISFGLRGPYMSNFLKRKILKEISKSTGKQAIAGRFYVNLFPLFVGANDVKLFDEDGHRIVGLRSVKAYASLSNILGREIWITRLYLDAPEITLDAATLDEITANIKKYNSAKSGGAFSVKLKILEIRDMAYAFKDEQAERESTGKGIDITVNIREFPDIDFSSKELTAKLKGLPEFKVEAKGAATITKDGFKLKRLNVTSFGSMLNGVGAYQEGNRGRFTAEIEVLVDTLKSVFGLKQSGSGKIIAKGAVEFAGNLKNPLIDIDVKGDMRLETLMEFLGAKTGMKLRGLLDFSGKISGHIKDLKADAKARLRRGAIFGVEVDDLKCKVVFGDGLLVFKDGDAKLYGGTGTLGASIKIPGVLPYTVDVSVKDVSSEGLLKLINLKVPGLSPGRVTGTLHTAGDAFSPSGRFIFETADKTDHPIGRISNMEGNYALTNGVVSIDRLFFDTGLTRGIVNGSLSTNNRAIGFDGEISTKDIRDLSSPYFDKARGTARLIAIVNGTIESPRISLKLSGRDLSVMDYAIGDFHADAQFKDNVLRIHKFRSIEGGVVHFVRGDVSFKDADTAFDFKHPEFDISAGIRNAPVSEMLRPFVKSVVVGGVADADITIKGRDPVIAGSLKLSSPKVGGYLFSSASGNFSYSVKDTILRLSDVQLKRHDSSLFFAGTVTNFAAYEFTAHSDGLHLHDILPSDAPLDYKLDVEAQGKGTFKNPAAGLTVRLHDGFVKSEKIPDGLIHAEIKGQDIKAEMKLLGDMIDVSATAVLANGISWAADIQFNNGKYESLVRPFWKNMPEDASIAFEGRVVLKGTDKTIEGEVRLPKMNAAVYEQAFINQKEIKFRFSGRKVEIESFILKSGDAAFTAEGRMEVGKSFDISLAGTSSLAPLKRLSDKVETIIGSAKYLLTVKGDWKKPSFNGEVDVSGGKLAIKGIPQRLTSINGKLSVDGRRIVLQGLDAKLGGGDVSLSGFMTLDGYEVTKTYIDMVLNNVTISFSRNFWVNVGGNAIFRFGPDYSDINGELRINRAKIAEPVEWRTWLLTSKRSQASKAAPWMEKTKLNLKVYGVEGINVDNNIARATVKVDMLLRGTLAHVTAFGRVEAREGKVFFRNNEFRIISATADFSDQTKINPYFTISAETFTGGYHIWLGFDGQFDRFNLTLTSDPPLDEVSILGLLTVGKFGDRLSGLEGGIGAAEAASFLTGKYQEVIQERVRDITGLDRIQVDPYVSKATGSVVPRITVSKKLLGEKLYVTYSSSVSATDEQILRLEYFIDNNFSLLGVRDERGSVGGDIKFRFRFK